MALRPTIGLFNTCRQRSMPCHVQASRQSASTRAGVDAPWRCLFFATPRCICSLTSPSTHGLVEQRPAISATRPSRLYSSVARHDSQHLAAPAFTVGTQDAHPDYQWRSLISIVHGTAPRLVSMQRRRTTVGSSDPHHSRAGCPIRRDDLAGRADVAAAVPADGRTPQFVNGRHGNRRLHHGLATYRHSCEKPICDTSESAGVAPRT